MNFQNCHRRLSCSGYILCDTLVSTLITIAGVLDYQIATVHNSNALRVGQIDELSILAPVNGRLGITLRRTALQEYCLTKGHTCVLRFQSEVLKHCRGGGKRLC